MAKVKCKVCANEVNGYCKIKKVSVSLNKKRRCEAYVYDESKFKAKEKIPVTKIGYKQLEENKKRYKEEMKRLRKIAKQTINQKEAEKLERVPKGYTASVGTGYEKTDGGIWVPKNTRDPKHPLTGDLSRFTTTAKKDEE